MGWIKTTQMNSVLYAYQILSHTVYLSKNDTFMLPLRFSWGIDFPSNFHNARPLLLLKRRHRRHLHSYVSWWPKVGKRSFGKGCPFWKCKCWFFVSTQMIHKSLKHRLFPAFFVWWPNRVRVPNYPKYQLFGGLVDGSVVTTSKTKLQNSILAVDSSRRSHSFKASKIMASHCCEQSIHNRQLREQICSYGWPIIDD